MSLCSWRWFRVTKRRFCFLPRFWRLASPKKKQKAGDLLAQQPALKARLVHKNGTLGARGFFLSRQDLHRGFALTIEALLRQKNPLAPRLQKWYHLTKIASW